MDDFNGKSFGGFGEGYVSVEEMDSEEDVKPEIKEEEDDEFEDGENEEEEMEFTALVNENRNAVRVGLPLPLPITFIQPIRAPVPVQIRPNLRPPPPPVFIKRRTLTESRCCLLCYNRCSNDNSTPIVLESSMEADFRVMFVLKKMLKIPNENLTEYLKEFGGNRGIPPRNWIAFCNFCQATINEALGVQKKITKLEEKLKCFQTEMTERIKKSQKSRKKVPAAQSVDDVIRVTNEARSFVATGKFPRYSGMSGLAAAEVPNVAVAVNSVNQDVPVVKLKPKRRKRRSLKNRSMAQKEAFKRVHEARWRKPAEKLSKKNEPISTPSSPPPPSPPSPLPPSSPLPSPSHSDSDMDYDVTITIENSDDEDDVQVQEKSKVVQTSREDAKSVKATVKTADLVALKKGSYRCSLCPHINFEMNFNLFCGHLLFHYRRPYKCSGCNAHFASNTALELDSSPINVVRNEADPSGHLCSSATLTRVETTLEFQNLLIWGCEYCDEKFNSHPERDLHERNCSKRKSSALIKSTTSCDLCQKRFRNVVERRFHMILEHPDEAKVSCNYCEETFPVKTKEGTDLLDEVKLKEHQLQCHRFKNKNLPNMSQTLVHCCDFCGEPFWSATNSLLGHMETFHKIPRNKTFSCEICHFRTYTKNKLRHHSQSNHYVEGKNIMICEICGHENTKRTLFDHHKFKEHGIVPLNRPLVSCPEEGCDFKIVFGMGEVLKHHKMSKHNAVRQHKCETCGKEFLNSSKLKCHQEIHLNKNLKPFQCELCGNSFAVKNYLYIHMRLSHQNRPFASTHKKKPARKKNAAKPIKESSTDTNTLPMDPEIKNDHVEGVKEDPVPDT